MIGTTLSQIGLAKRLGRPTSAIRAMWETVIGTNGNGEKETWARECYASDGRLIGYRLMKVEPRASAHSSTDRK